MSYRINRERLKKSFVELVRIDSETGKEKALAGVLTKKLKRLGARVERDRSGNLIAKFKGRGQGQGQGQPIMLAAHMDTVKPGKGIVPVLKGGCYRSKGNTILAADPKAGIAAILEGIKVTGKDTKRPPIEVVLTPKEEDGLKGSRKINYDFISARRGVEFDGEGPVSQITISAPGRIRLDIVMRGRAAHAGVEPEKGLSAIKMAARFVNGFPKGRLDTETTANIGSIRGGSQLSVVPDVVKVAAEIRSVDKKKLDKLEKRIVRLSRRVRKEFPRGSVTCRPEFEYAGYRRGPKDKTVAWVAQGIRAIGLKPTFEPSGGGTDANNYLAHEPRIDIVVVGLGGNNFHTQDEELPVENLVNAARFCAAILRSDA